MSIRYHLARTLGKLTSTTLKLAKRNATSLPGKLALKVDPDFLKHLSHNMDFVMVTGTNGKTLTTSLITHTLRQKYKVVTNESGSNMIQGIASTLLKSKNHEVGVLEVDEANLKLLTPVLNPRVIVFTNVFRDQMDRFGEIYTTYQFMKDGAELAPKATLIMNGDTPLFNDETLANPKKYFGFNHKDKKEVIPHPNTDGLLCPKCHSLLKYDLITYSNLGSYHCDECGFSRPHLDFEVSKLIDLKRDSSTFEINHHSFSLQVGGLYNIYNALAAYGVAKEFGLSDNQIQDGFTSTPMKFGRQEIFKYKNKEIILNLVKNPVGFNQIVDLIELDSKPKALISLLNDNYADGIDISWIWDADYEKLRTLNITETHIGGKRKEDLKTRMEVAKFNPITVIDDLNNILSTIDSIDSDNIYILSTYTALLHLREILSKSNVVNMEMK